MKLTVLNNDVAGKKCLAEYGISFLIEAEKKILFDGGYTDTFIKNANAIGVSLDIDYVVLSHGHWDHGNGLKFLKGKKLVCHPDCFMKRYKKESNRYMGLKFGLDEAKNNFEVILSKNPYNLSKNIVFLGEIPRMNSFEAKRTPFYKGEKEDDYVMDDSALAIISKNGLILIAGCSHAGICNIIEYAKKVTGIKKIFAVVGGFHLLENDEVLDKTIDYFKKEKVKKLYPMHCTELPAMSKFYEIFKIKQTHSGDIITI